MDFGANASERHFSRPYFWPNFHCFTRVNAGKISGDNFSSAFLTQNFTASGRHDFGKMSGSTLDTSDPGMNLMCFSRHFSGEIFPKASDGNFGVFGSHNFEIRDFSASDLAHVV